MSTANVHLTKFKAQLEEWQAQVDQLKAKAKQARADVKIEYDRKIKQFEDKLEDAKTRQSKLKDAGEEAWNDLSSGLSAAWNDVKKAFD